MNCNYCGEPIINSETHECERHYLIEKIDELGAALASSQYLKSEFEKTARIMADAADANVKSAAYERIEHARTAAILRQIIAESGSYLQAKTRESAIERVACTGNAVCLPNVQVQRPEGKTQP